MEKLEYALSHFLDNRFIFLYDEKIHVNGFDFLLLNIYRRHLSPLVRKTCPIPNLPLIGEKKILSSLQPKRCKCSYYTLLNQIFGHLSWFLWTKTVIFLIFFKDYYFSAEASWLSPFSTGCWSTFSGKGFWWYFKTRNHVLQYSSPGTRDTHTYFLAFGSGIELF